MNQGAAALDVRDLHVLHHRGTEKVPLVEGINFQIAFSTLALQSKT